MKNKFYILLPLFAVLVGCSKTNELYARNQYNSPVFDENYYTSYSGLDEIQNTNQDINKTFSYPEGSYESYAEGRNLSLVSNKFKSGILSRLYDGESWCGSKYQLARLQLNKTGFGAKLPLKLKTASTFEFVARGGTSPEISKLPDNERQLAFNFTVSLFTPSKIINYKLDNVILPTDSGGVTRLVSFSVGEEVKDTYGYSIKYECVSLPNNVTDNKDDKEKDHLAIMLYEVLFGDSTWSK